MVAQRSLSEWWSMLKRDMPRIRNHRKPSNRRHPVGGGGGGVLCLFVFVLWEVIFMQYIIRCLCYVDGYQALYMKCHPIIIIMIVVMECLK